MHACGVEPDIAKYSIGGGFLSHWLAAFNAAHKTNIEQEIEQAVNENGGNWKEVWMKL